LIVADLDGVIVGTLQLAFTPSLAIREVRMSIESVRVDSKLRGKGVGREMMLWAIESERKRLSFIQLTTHNDRKMLIGSTKI
jgi:predicted GNAT family acetyltransferase